MRFSRKTNKVSEAASNSLATIAEHLSVYTQQQHVINHCRRGSVATTLSVFLMPTLFCPT